MTPDRDLSFPTQRAWLCWGLLAFLIPFQLHYNYLINLFYHVGAGYNDAGILSQLVWHGDWKFTPPPVFTNYSFFGVHFIPFFLPFNALSHFLPVPMAEYYSAIIAAIYAALSLSLFCALRLIAAPRRHRHLAGLALIAVGFAFSAPVMHGIWSGHFEYAIPLGIFLFLLCDMLGRKGWAAFFFLLALSVREDAGLHLVTVLGVLALLRWRERRSLRAVKREAWLMLAALTYTAFAFWVTAASRGYHGSTLGMIYLGSPPLAHLSWELLCDRALLIARDHIHVWAGLLLTLIAAFRMKNPYMAAGFVSCLPWLLVNWLAYNENTAKLYAYYSFPFLLALSWPVLGTLLRHGRDVPPDVARQAMRLQAALVAVGLLMWNPHEQRLAFGPVYGASWGGYALEAGARNRALVREFVVKFEAGAGGFGTVMADDGALSLMKSGKYRGRDLLRLDTDKPADTLLYMNAQPSPPPEVIAQAQKRKLNHHSCVAGTTLCLFTRGTARAE